MPPRPLRGGSARRASGVRRRRGGRPCGRDRTSRSAISALDSPSATRRRISTCRAVRPAGFWTASPAAACAGDACTPSSRSRAARERCGGPAPEPVQGRRRLEGRLDLARTRPARAPARRGRRRALQASAAARQSPRDARARTPRGQPGKGSAVKPEALEVAHQLAALDAACRAGRCAPAAARGKAPGQLGRRRRARRVRSRASPVGHQPLQDVGCARRAGSPRSSSAAASGSPWRTSSRARIGSVSRPIMPGSPCPSSSRAQPAHRLGPATLHASSRYRRASNM